MEGIEEVAGGTPPPPPRKFSTESDKDLVLLESLEHKPIPGGSSPGSAHSRTDSIEVDDGPKEISCHFFGTFYNDNNLKEESNDLIIYNVPVRITELRVIPLGATVLGEMGMAHLGSTNPNKFDLEFFYQDLTDPASSVFKKLNDEKFTYESSSSIQLDFNDEENPIIAGKILVRGIYNSVTLATYGYEARNFPIKEPPVPIPVYDGEEQADKMSMSPEDQPKDNGVEQEFTTDVDSQSEFPCKEDLVTKTESFEHEDIEDIEMKDSFEEENHLATSPEGSVGSRSDRSTSRQRSLETNHATVSPDKKSEQDEFMDIEEKVESVSSEEVSFDDLGGDIPLDKDIEKPEELPLIETEDISDGEISSDEFDILIKQPTNKEKEIVTNNVDPNLDPSKDNHVEQLSDQEFEDDFQEGVEEIISDEEMPEYPESEPEDDFDLLEYEEIICKSYRKFGDPYTFDLDKILPLKNFNVSNHRRKVPTEAEITSNKIKRIAKLLLTVPSVSERWVEILEDFLANFETIMLNINYKENLEDSVGVLRYWINKCFDLEPITSGDAFSKNLRQLKIGLRVSYNLSYYDEVLTNKIGLFQLGCKELSLQEYLVHVLLTDHTQSPSIQYLAIKSLDMTISTRSGFVSFTEKKSKENNMTLYETLVLYYNDMYCSKRFGFLLSSLLKKVNIIYTLINLERCTKLNLRDALEGFEFLHYTTANIEQMIAYPKHFLPAQAVVEINWLNCGNDFPERLCLVKLFKQFNFIKSSLKVLELNNFNPPLTGIMSKILYTLMSWDVGLIYLAEDEFMPNLLNSFEVHHQSTIVEYFLHSYDVLKALDLLNSLEPDSTDDLNSVFSALHQVYVGLSTSRGRKAITEVLTVGYFVRHLFKVDIMEEDKAEIIYYIIEIVTYVVENSNSSIFLKLNGEFIYNYLSGVKEGSEYFDKISTIKSFLMPALEPRNFTVDGIENISKFLKSKAGHAEKCDPEIVTLLRILNGLCLKSPNLDEVDDPNSMRSDPLPVQELKYKLACVVMNSNDILSTLLEFLKTTNEQFTHPSVIVLTFLNTSSHLRVTATLLAVRLIRRILSEIILVRNINFDDMSSIEILIQTYFNCHFIPKSSISFSNATIIKEHVIGILLAFSTPTMKLGEETEAQLTNSIWTKMIVKLVRLTLNEPMHFIPGLKLLSELLPTPLPIPHTQEYYLEETEKQQLISLRRLWSAFLHGASTEIHEMIGALCESDNNELLSLLQQVCLQLSDLSAPTCLLVCKSIMGTIVSSLETDIDEEQAKNKSTKDYSNSTVTSAWIESLSKYRIVKCSARSSRLLNFLKTLIKSSGVIKAGFIQTCRASKLEDKLTEFISMLTSLLISKAPLFKVPALSHRKAQEHAISIFCSICDPKLNIFFPIQSKVTDLSQNSTDLSLDYMKLNSLPPKEILSTVSNTLLTFLDIQENILDNFTIIRKVFNALNVLTTSELGFNQLKLSIGRNPSVISNFLHKLKIERLEILDIVGVMESLDVVEVILKFISNLITPMSRTPRSIESREAVITVSELCKFVSWDKSSEENNETNPLKQLNAYLEKSINTNKGTTGEEQELLRTYMSETHNRLKSICSYLDSQELEGEFCSTTDLITNVQPDSLIDLFAKKSVAILCTEIQLESLNLPRCLVPESERQPSDLATCDLMEVFKGCLPSLDIVKELETMIRIGKDSEDKTEINKNSQQQNANFTGATSFGIVRNNIISLLGPTPGSLMFNQGFRGGPARGGFGRGILLSNVGTGRSGFDPFRSRPPNTSRPPSLHVDDFIAMESSGQNSLNSTNFNKNVRGGGLGQGEMFRGRGSRGSPSSRPYNTRPSPYPSRGGFGQSNNMNPGAPRGRGRGRSYGAGTDRWTPDCNNGMNRSSPGPSSYQSPRPLIDSSSRNSGSNNSSNRARTYRGGSYGKDSSGNNNANSRSPSNPPMSGGGSGGGGRWREHSKPRQFNR